MRMRIKMRMKKVKCKNVQMYEKRIDCENGTRIDCETKKRERKLKLKNKKKLSE
jgi:hypothetical protein